MTVSTSTSGESRAPLFPMSPVARWCVAGLLGLLFVSGLLLYVFPDSGSLSTTPVASLLVVLCAILCQRCLAVPHGRRVAAFGTLYGVLLGLAFVVSSNLAFRGSTRLGSLTTWGVLVALAPTLCVYATAALDGLLKVSAEKTPTAREGWLTARLWGSPHRFWILWGLILLAWLPLLLAVWPGLWRCDAIYQTQWLLTGEGLSTHHPLVHTLWMSLPMEFSYQVTGSYVPGFAFYTVTQELVCSALYAGTLHLLAKRDVPSWVLWLGLAVFALFPGIVIYAAMSTKDVAFVAFFTFTLALLLELGRHPTRKNQVGLWFAFLATMLFRNNAAYALLVFAVVLALCRKRWAPLLFFGSAIAVWYVLSGPLPAALGVEAGSAAEMMSVPAVQLARAAETGELTEEQTTFVETYVPSRENYDETIADSVKGDFNVDLVKEDPVAFIKGYLDIGLTCPGAYVTAFLRLTAAYWAPIGDALPDARTGYWSLSNRVANEGDTAPYILIDQASLLRGASEAIEKLGNASRKVPLLASIENHVTWFWALALLALCGLCGRRHDMNWASLFFFLYWLTLQLGPVAQYRYGYVSIPVAMVFLMLLFSKPKNLALRPVHKKQVRPLK